MKILAAVAVQPLVAAVLGVVAFPLFFLDRNGQALAGGSPPNIGDAAVSIGVGVGLVAFIVTLVGALPTALWLMKRRRISLLEALAFGLGFGNLPFALGTLTAGTYGISGFLRGMGFSSLLGVAGAGVFWCIALRQRIESTLPPGDSV